LPTIYKTQHNNRIICVHVQSGIDGLAVRTLRLC